MTDLPTRREIHDSIAAKFRTAPEGADANGKTDIDRAQDAATIARITGDLDAPLAAAPAIPEGAPPALRPNPAQGASSATPAAPTGSGDSVLDRMRAHARQALDG